MPEGFHFVQSPFEIFQADPDATAFEITVGVALYADSEDVRWLYIGCRCPECNLSGCYGDWKNEFIGFRDLLARV